MTIEELFVEVGIATPDGERVREEWLSADCPSCGNRVQLVELERRENGDETEYVCDCGSAAVAINWTKLDNANYNYGLKGTSDVFYVLTPVKALYVRLPNGNVITMPGGPRPS